jgi:uncharacterized phiE125 gp8 family phage protein
MAWSVTTPPADEPVALDEAKLHLRVDVTDDDTLIGSLIQAARQHVEAVCERALMPQVWTERRSAFPALPCHLRPLRAPTLDQLTILLAGGVVRAIDSVKYVDTTGTLQTVDPATYVADLTAEPAQLAPLTPTQWPVAREQPGAVQIQYQVGYADAASVPAALRAAVLLLVGDMYANREAFAAQPMIENPALNRLLDPYKRVQP